MPNSDRDTLIEEIHAAFRNVPRGELSISQAQIAKWADESKLRAARLLDHDKHWSDISDRTIEAASNAIYVDDQFSWRYFLPAYLRWTLRHFENSDLFIVDQPIYTPSVNEIGDPLRKHQVLRFETLSPAQKTCLCHFLQ